MEKSVFDSLDSSHTRMGTPIQDPAMGALQGGIHGNFPRDNEEETDLFVDRLVREILERESSPVPPSCVPFRIYNAKQVSLEIKSAEKIIKCLNEINIKIQNMYDHINMSKNELLRGMQQEPRYVCTQIETKLKPQTLDHRSLEP